MPSLLRRATSARFFATALAAALIGFPTVTFAMRGLARHFVFPSSQVETLPAPPDAVAWTLTARDGVRVRALELPAGSNSRVFVYFHNNRETMVHGVAFARELRQRGFSVVLPEYRGYGLVREVGPSEDGLYADAEAVLDHLNAHGIGSERIVLCGMSLGTGVAAEMARRGRGGALVLIAPYTSLPDVVTDVVPVLPARLFMPDRFDTLGKAREIRVPTLVLHGDADEIVPFRMGRELAHSIAGARFVSVPGGHHGDLFARDGAHLLREIVAFARGRERPAA